MNWDVLLLASAVFSALKQLFIGYEPLVCLSFCVPPCILPNILNASTYPEFELLFWGILVRRFEFLCCGIILLGSHVDVIDV